MKIIISKLVLLKEITIICLKQFQEKKDLLLRCATKLKQKHQMKYYKKSKAINFKQELERFRRYGNLPQSCSQLNKIKIRNLREFDKQFNLARLCIKNKLFEITQEFKHFKL